MNAPRALMLVPEVRVLPRLADATGPTLFVYFEQRYHWKRGGGYWCEWQDRKRTGLSWGVNLAIPRVTEWTVRTLDGVLAIMRQELEARGARGSVRVTARLKGWFGSIETVDLAVRRGDLRATVAIDAPVIHFAVPPAVVIALPDRVSRPTPALRRDVQRVRDLAKQEA